MMAGPAGRRGCGSERKTGTPVSWGLERIPAGDGWQLAVQVLSGSMASPVWVPLLSSHLAPSLWPGAAHPPNLSFLKCPKVGSTMVPARCICSEDRR